MRCRILRSRCPRSARSLKISARIWPTPNSASAGLVTPRSVCTNSAARASRFGGRGRSRENLFGQRLEPALAGQRGQRLLLGLERQVEVFQPLGAISGLDLGRQRFGQFALRFDGAQDRLLSFPQQTQLAQTLLNLPDLLLVQPAGFIFAVTSDERNGVARIQQFDDALDARQRDLQRAGDRPEIDSDRRDRAHAITALVNHRSLTAADCQSEGDCTERKRLSRFDLLAAGNLGPGRFVVKLRDRPWRPSRASVTHLSGFHAAVRIADAGLHRSASAKKTQRAAKFTQTSASELPIPDNVRAGTAAYRVWMRGRGRQPQDRGCAVKPIHHVRKRTMARTQLRVYYGPQAEAPLPPSHCKPQGRSDCSAGRNLSALGRRCSQRTDLAARLRGRRNHDLDRPLRSHSRLSALSPSLGLTAASQIFFREQSPTARLSTAGLSVFSCARSNASRWLVPVAPSDRPAVWPPPSGPNPDVSVRHRRRI